MRRKFVTVAVLMVVLIAVLDIWAADPAPAPVKKDVVPADKMFVYKHSGGKPREIQVFFPPNHDPAKAKVPGVILFHGGGWAPGTGVDYFRDACQYFASRGLVAASATYQTLPKEGNGNLAYGAIKVPCTVDAKSAIRWMKQHAEELGIDPKKLIVGGGSAGGHIAVLATTNPGLNDPDDPKDIDTSVVAYMLFNPAFSKRDSETPDVDAMRYLKADFAPAIVFFGTQDGWYIHDYSLLHNRFKELKIENRIQLWIAVGQTHGFFCGDNNPWLEVCLVEADRFLASLGLLQGEPTAKPLADPEKRLRRIGPEEELVPYKTRKDDPFWNQ